MISKRISVRVRPYRVAVLISKTASADEIQLALSFLSQLWGGVWSSLLAVEPASTDELAIFRLGELRPDLIYGVGLDDELWHHAVVAACQPRGYAALTDTFVRNLSDSYEEFITTAHVCRHYGVNRQRHEIMQSRMRLVSANSTPRMNVLVQAVFGAHSSYAPEDIRMAATPLTEEDNARLITLHSEFVRDQHISWLHFATTRLTVKSHGFPSYGPPTLVLVNSLAEDISLFWNIRAGHGIGGASWILPILHRPSANAGIAPVVSEWLRAFANTGFHAAFCRVTSASLDADQIQRECNALERSETTSSFVAFDPWRPPNRLPIMIAYERKATVAARLAGRTVSFQTPGSCMVPSNYPGRWIIEFLREASTRRAVCDLVLPSRVDSTRLLRAPGPDRISLRNIPALGDGREGINFLCSARGEITSAYLPTPTEIAEEILRSGGCCPLRDEKRACYAPVIRKFGGIEGVSRAVLGSMGAILQSLRTGPKRVRQIKSEARLGNGELPDLNEVRERGLFRDVLDPETTRILEARMRQRFRRILPSDRRVESLLEYWADKGVLQRRGYLGVCKSCMQPVIPSMREVEELRECPSCGARVRIPSNIEVMYVLEPLIAHALKEGLAPVALTARFLKRFTNDGFMFVPGAKYSRDEQKGDLDLVACCDGVVVWAECKDLRDVPEEEPVWDESLQQFVHLYETARACGCQLAVFAAMARNVPERLRVEIDRLGAGTVATLVLTGEDLENGERSITVGGQSARSYGLRDALRERFPESECHPVREERTWTTPWFSMVSHS